MIICFFIIFLLKKKKIINLWLRMWIFLMMYYVYNPTMFLCVSVVQSKSLYKVFSFFFIIQLLAISLGSTSASTSASIYNYFIEKITTATLYCVTIGDGEENIIEKTQFFKYLQVQYYCENITAMEPLKSKKKNCDKN